MSRAQRTPVVPLEAGAGPENPPCPACGEPLFGWADAGAAAAGPVRRCESCGLGVVGDPVSADEALRALDELRQDGTVLFANRASLSAWLGTAGWAGIDPPARCLFTVEAVRRLVARRDQVVERARWAPATGIATMWQTILNGFTFGRNVALGAFGRTGATPAGRPWERRLDVLISLAVAIPAMLVAIPLEAVAAACGRGSALKLTTELL